MRGSMSLLVLLLPLIPAAASGAPANPSGAVVWRPECYGGPQEEQLAAAPSPAPRPPNMPPVSTRSPASKPSASPKKSPPMAPPPPPAAEAPAMDFAEDSVGVGGGASAGAVGGISTGDAESHEKSKRATASKSAEEGERDESLMTVPPRPQGPSLEYGATVFLSNDDSMSLASAQRLLYALQNRVGFSVSEIRAHELLNYFSFDTVTPDADQTFDVLAAAEQDGDQLSVALAVKGATPPRQKLDLTLVVDRSCSMAEEGRMDYTRRGLSVMASQLEQGDRVDLVLFDDRVCVPLENYVVGRDDPALLAQAVALMQPEGSTDVGLGLRTAYGVAKKHLDTQGRNRRVMIVTDAMMNTGDVDPNTVSEIGRAYDADDIRLTGVGVGRGFNDQVLNQLTEKGKGAYVFLGSEAVVDRVFGPIGFGQLTQTIAHDVHFALKLPPSLAMKRFYGEESSTVKEDVQPIHYSAGTSQLFLQDLVVKGGRVVPSDPVVLEIEYRDARTGEPETRTFRTTVGEMVRSDAHNVHKAQALMSFADLLTEQAMGGDPCGSPLDVYASRAGRVTDDAEIAFVNGLVRGQCGDFELPAVVSNRGVPFKVRVDSDIPVSQVALSCGATRRSESLTAADVVAMFTVPPGVCELTLSGTVDMTARVEVPSAGGDMRCLIRGGRVSCS